MENASKALVMAAEILIGVLLISLAVYLFSNYSQTSKKIHADIEQQRLQQFNSQYTAYLNRSDLTIYDIRTIINNVRANNTYYAENDTKYQIKVIMEGMNSIGIVGVQWNEFHNINNNKFDEIVRKDQESISSTNSNLPKYTCRNISFDNETHRVSIITFKRN